MVSAGVSLASEMVEAIVCKDLLLRHGVRHVVAYGLGLRVSVRSWCSENTCQRQLSVWHESRSLCFGLLVKLLLIGMRSTTPENYVRNRNPKPVCAKHSCQHQIDMSSYRSSSASKVISIILVSITMLRHAAKWPILPNRLYSDWPCRDRKIGLRCPCRLSRNLAGRTPRNDVCLCSAQAAECKHSNLT